MSSARRRGVTVGLVAGGIMIVGVAAAATFTVSPTKVQSARIPATPPAPSGALSTTKVAGSTTHFQAQSGDVLSIIFKAAVDPTTICPAWDGVAYANGSTLNSRFTVTIKTVSGGNNQLTITGNCPSTSTAVHIGTVDLGTTGYAGSSNTTFSGTGSNATNIALSSDRTVLTVVLGGSGTTSQLVSSTTTGTATFTADSNMKTASGTAVTTGQTSVGLLF